MNKTQVLRLCFGVGLASVGFGLLSEAAQEMTGGAFRTTCMVAGAILIVAGVALAGPVLKAFRMAYEEVRKFPGPSEDIREAVEYAVTRISHKKVQWSEVGNVWHNAAIRTAVYMPVYFTKRIFGRA